MARSHSEACMQPQQRGRRQRLTPLSFSTSFVQRRIVVVMSGRELWWTGVSSEQEAAHKRWWLEPQRTSPNRDQFLAARRRHQRVRLHVRVRPQPLAAVVHRGRGWA